MSYYNGRGRFYSDRTGKQINYVCSYPTRDFANTACVNNKHLSSHSSRGVSMAALSRVQCASSVEALVVI